MAKKFLVQIDFNALEALNFRFQNLAAAPSSPTAGRTYYDSVQNALYVYNGTAWVAADPGKSAAGSIPNAALATNPLARANHTGTQAASTISDLASVVQGYSLNQFAAATAPVNMGAQRLTAVADPTTSQDAATKNYVDNLLNGTDWKPSVRAATTANVTLSGLQTIDGISVAAGERVLVKNQTTATQNGIYLAASGAWTRTVDADGSGEISAATAVMVEEGISQADTQWRVTTDGSITIGTSAIAFAQIGASTSYASGTGISIAGNVVSVDAAVVVRKAAATIGDGTATSIAVAHNLGTQDIDVRVRDASTNAAVECDWVATSATTATLSFAVAPALNSLRAVIHA